MTTIAAFLVAILLLVTVHEWGHYRMARACGVRVLRFSVGFGPVLWRRQTQPEGTEWVVCALPLGGYVRMLDSREGDVAPQDLPQAFDRRPLLARSLIVAAGPLANLVLAVFLYCIAAWWGTQEPVARVASPLVGSLVQRSGLLAGDRVQRVCEAGGAPHSINDENRCVEVRSLAELHWALTRAALDRRAIELQVSGGRRIRLDLTTYPGPVDDQFLRGIGLTGAFSEAVIQRVIEGGAAAESGLMAGDLVLSVDGIAVVDAAGLRARIRGTGAGSTGAQEAASQRWSVLRQGRELTLEVRPRIAQLPNGDRVGRVEAAIGGTPETAFLSLGPIQALRHGVDQALEMSWLTVRMVGRMLLGEASLKQLSGPLSIADAAGQSAQGGVAHYLGFLAVVSISLFVLNLLPLPMLDGGHLMYHLYEYFSGRAPSDVWLERMQRAGIVLLLALMALALGNDVMRLLGLN